MKRFWFILLLVVFLSACQVVTQPAVAEITVTIQADEKTINVKIPANSTVQTALVQGGITIGSLDRVEPPINTIVATNDRIKVVRVQEEYSEQNETIPFEKQVIKNESLPEGETRLLQPGVNGEKVVTYKKVIEDNVEVSNLEFKTVVMKDPVPEITMVGVQAPFSSRTISGLLAYIDNGNAWVIDQTTGNRKPLVTTGDLDGHIFAVSYDRQWLLYSRKGDTTKGVLNTLWVIRTNKDGANPIDLQIKNVINFGDFIPSTPQTIAYSTVEPRDSAPGWQANNDLIYKNFTSAGTTGAPIKKVDSNSGGIYGWWGVTYLWSPDGSRLAFTRPDGVGTVTLGNGSFNTAESITPYDTHSDWAWVPGLTWSPDGKFLFTSTHNKTGNPDKPESSTVFDLSAVALGDQKYTVNLSGNTGMFSNPVASPYETNGSYMVAYLQAIFPEQSDNSRYRLVVMDQDGSNKSTLYPDEGSPGLTAQNISWSPDFQNGAYVTILYNGNLWLVDVSTKERYQVTGDSLVTRVSWR
jgi:resuscitation-promoting factor RpfB